jgi:hypothetical protein
MLQALKMLRLVQWCLLLSILLYAVVAELKAPGAHPVNPTVSYLFSMLAVATVGVIFVIRRTLVLRAAESLATHPDDVLSLNHWKTGFIATYALCEALALFGLVLRFLGCTFQQSVLFYIGGFVLLFFFRPKEPVAASAS